MENKQLEIINHYGIEHQLERLTEECGELIVAIAKCKRYGKSESSIDYLNNLIEEMADVENLIEQIKARDEIAAEVMRNIKETKVNRELERIEQHLK